jgi:hypothetical protein
MEGGIGPLTNGRGGVAGTAAPVSSLMVVDGISAPFACVNK